MADYLSRGRDALSRGQLIAPVQDNARFYIGSARALAPDDPQVRQAVQDLITRLVSSAQQALLAKDSEQADIWASAAADAGADAPQVASLHDEAKQQRSAARADALARLTASFNERLEQGHVVDPATDSARFYLAQLVREDAASTATQLARGAYRARVLDEARSALHAQDLAGTRRWLVEARAVGADPTETGTLDAALTAAQEQAQQDNAYVNESTLTRTHYVPPQYPGGARERGIDGWVDLQFLVGTDGTVDDVRVVGAEPAGVFEQSALDAVRRWRYQPVMRGGHSVSQRARVRLRFAVRD